MELSQKELLQEFEPMFYPNSIAVVVSHPGATEAERLEIEQALTQA